MTNTHTSIFSGLLVALFLTLPANAYAYLLPEDVLLSDEFILPPSSREAETRVAEQSETSAKRRELEHAAALDSQHPTPVVEEETDHTSAEDPANLTDDERELLETLRLLERIETQQEVLKLTGAHSGAPRSPEPLAPTGAGGILTAITMLGATVWTLRRSGRSHRVIAQ